MPLSAGEKLGPYEILAPLGAGGMGEVWKARDTRLDRIVAIKRLTGPHTARFEQEARAIAALNHPHICQIYDIGASPEGFGYLVMEYIDGAPLQGPRAFAEALPLAIQIAGALEEAHARGIIHRDLKPGNILIASKGAKLLDFGLAKLAEPSGNTLTLTGAVMGTPAYMSPEQIEGKPLDQRTDVFSFGAVLYELLAGRRAFESLAAILRDDTAPLSSPAAAIVTKCLAKDPAQRFHGMAEVRAALENLAAKPVEHQPSIAVLPFANMSRDADDEYFSDGLAEEIINALAQLPGLKVTARTSAFAFRGKEQDIRRIAEALGVRTVLEGSVRRSGNRIRVTAQLINAADGYHLWSQRFDREMADVFVVQDEISAAIAGALQVKLTGTPARQHQPNLQAYEALLRGRQQMFRTSPEAFARARQYLEQAIALDPEYAEPHSELAWYYFALGAWSLRPAKETMPLARAEAKRALKLSALEPMAHAVLAIVADTHDYDWKEAEREYRALLAADGVTPDLRGRAAHLHLVPLGRFQEAVRELETALEQDPLNGRLRMFLSMTLKDAGTYDRAIAEARKLREIEERYWGAYWVIGHCYAVQGLFAEAREPAEKAFQLAPWNGVVAGTLAGILAHQGETDRAQQLLAAIPENAPTGRVNYHMLRSEIDAAADWYEKDIELRQPTAVLQAAAVWLQPLRDSPHWPRLAKMMNLPVQS